MPNFLLLPFIQAFCCHSNLRYKNMVANILLLLILIKYMALRYTGQQQKPYPYLTILINRCHPGFCRTISTKIAISSVSMDTLSEATTCDCNGVWKWKASLLLPPSGCITARVTTGTNTSLMGSKSVKFRGRTAEVPMNLSHQNWWRLANHWQRPPTSESTVC